MHPFIPAPAPDYITSNDYFNFDRDILDNAKPVAKPVIHIVVGGPGSGKSWQAERIVEREKLPLLDYDNGFFIHMDACEGRNPADVAVYKDCLDGFIHLYEHYAVELISKRASFVMSTSFTNPRILELLSWARANGYQIEGTLIGAPLDLQTARIDPAKRGYAIPGTDVNKKTGLIYAATGQSPARTLIGLSEKVDVLWNNGDHNPLLAGSYIYDDFDYFDETAATEFAKRHFPQTVPFGVKAAMRDALMPDIDFLEYVALSIVDAQKAILAKQANRNAHQKADFGGQTQTDGDIAMEVSLMERMAGISEYADRPTRFTCEETTLCDANRIRARFITQKGEIVLGDSWIIDPIDGTDLYANGQPGFGTMAALYRDGKPYAAWIVEPLFDADNNQTGFDVICGSVEQGLWQTRFNDDETMLLRPMPPSYRRSDVISFYDKPDYVKPEYAGAYAALKEDLIAAGYELEWPKSCVRHYKGLLRGDYDATMFAHNRPWDHAAGGILCAIAGYDVTTFAGNDYVNRLALLGGVMATRPSRNFSSYPVATHDPRQPISAILAKHFPDIATGAELQIFNAVKDVPGSAEQPFVLSKTKINTVAGDLRL